MCPWFIWIFFLHSLSAATVLPFPFAHAEYILIESVYLQAFLLALLIQVITGMTAIRADLLRSKFIENKGYRLE